ncbi:MAG TPA: hypothetical protein VEA60_10740 [Allosphingosinicella sp.]|nr:hypothetical protein [Allosphingosinicella sp.]
MTDLLAPLAVEAAGDGSCPGCGVDPCACAQLHIEPEMPPAAASAAPPPPPPGGPDGWRGDLSAIFRSPAPAAFLDARVDQLLRHGHSPAGDLEAPLDRLVRAADERLRHALEKLSPAGGDLAYALRKVEIAGACLLAAHDQLSARLAAERRAGEAAG